MRLFYLISGIIALYGCSPKTKAVKELIKADKAWLDSIQKNSDTSITKKYRGKDFFTAGYYINRKEKTVCQVMKDSSGNIRQVIADRNNIRIFTAEYYSNGQLKAKLPLDSTGKYHRQTKYYYQNGQVKSEGFFVHGFFSGQWKNYDEKGKFISKDEYDGNGQLIKTTKN